MNAQHTYSLIQFNTPDHIKQKLNLLSDYRRIPRNAIINEVIEQHIRNQFELIERDGTFTDLVSRVQEKVSRSLKRKKPEPVPTIEKKKTPENSWSWESSYA